ncbi:type III polyketide synthase [Alkalinema pantanalense CENA528]|uniref:type III polyketide synthase n=1 Tax=Alkalinema pantanalense TaxID=1620705 RepID=UPI003D6FEDBB
MHTVLDSIATANPSFEVSQVAAMKFMSQLEGLSPATRDRGSVIYTRSGIDKRYSCLPDYLCEPEDFSFYPNNWKLEPPPSTHDRNQKYQTSALAIAEAAAHQAIQSAQLDPAEITHLIVVSCTGFAAPGLDIQLVKRLGLPAQTDRTLIGFMGCYAAFNGLKTAHALCQSHPRARVLMVCVELCTLHFQAEDSIESVIINALFGDGAAAAILSTRSTAEAQGQLAYVEGCSLLTEDTMDLMTWTISNTGFLMHLSSKVPSAIVQSLNQYLTTFLERHHLTYHQIDFWAIHPGGRQIVDKIQFLLELSDAAVSDSYEVLRNYGNMSSCTILFILKRLLAQHQAGLPQGKGFQNGLALAFGPGLTIEGCLFQPV